MAKHDPTGATDYSADDLRAGHTSPDDAATGASVSDPLPPRPDDPYRMDEAADSTPEAAAEPGPGFFGGNRPEPQGSGDGAPWQATGFFGADLSTAPATGDYPEPHNEDHDSSPSSPAASYPTEHPSTYADSYTEDDDPPTDPSLPIAAGASGFGYAEAPHQKVDPYGFDPFDPDAFQPEVPWYRTRSAMLALTAIGIAVVALLIAGVLLLAGTWDEPHEPGAPSSTTTTTLAPTTTPQTSSPAPAPAPPPPPPPPPPSPAPNGGDRTYWPQYPRQNQGERNPGTKPQTRAPDISVRPTHRTAFPGQPGAN